MAPKKKGGKGGKGKKKNDIMDPEADLKAFNFAEKEALMLMYARMQELEEQNVTLKEETRAIKEKKDKTDEDFVSYMILVANMETSRKSIYGTPTSKVGRGQRSKCSWRKRRFLTSGSRMSLLSNKESYKTAYR